MDQDTLVGQVQARGKLGSRADAERAIRASLETLAERIPSGLAENLAAQLPHEIGEHLRRVAADPSHEMGERFGRAEFLQRLSERAGVDESRAAAEAGVVFGVVGEATPGAVMDRVRKGLPLDLRELLEEAG